MTKKKVEKKYAQVENGTIVGVVVATEEFGEYKTEVPEDVGIGFVKDGKGGFVPPVKPAKPVTVANCTEAARVLLNTQAVELGFDSILSAATYASEAAVPAFQADAKKLSAWRSHVWKKANDLLVGIEGGDSTLQTVAEFIDALPTYNG